MYTYTRYTITVHFMQDPAAIVRTTSTNLNSALWLAYTFDSFATRSCKKHISPHLDNQNGLGQTYLMFCCSSPAAQNFSILEKKKIWSRDWINIHTHEVRHKWLVCGSAWKSFQAALCYSGPESLTIPKRKAFSNLLARLEEDKFSESDFFFFFFFFYRPPYFVVKLARATKHQVGLALF